MSKPAKGAPVGLVIVAFMSPVIVVGYVLIRMIASGS